MPGNVEGRGRHIADIVQAHPRPGALDRDLLTEAVATLTPCAVTCAACADACLAEEQVSDLRRCIRLNLDCADACHTAAAMLLRQTEPDLQVLRAAVEACARACRSCGEECEKHAEMHEHCRLCAESCRHCEETCQRVLAALGQ